MNKVACTHGLRTCLLCEIAAASRELPPMRDTLDVLEARQADTDSALLAVSRRVTSLEHRALNEQAAQNRAADADERVLAAFEARVAALEAQVALTQGAVQIVLTQGAVEIAHAHAHAVRAELLRVLQQHPSLGLK